MQADIASYATATSRTNKDAIEVGIAAITIEPWNGHADMQPTRRLNLSCFYFIVTLLLTVINDAAHAVQSDSRTESQQQAPKNDSVSLTGRITDIVTAAGITYVEVDTGKGKVWAAVTGDQALGTGDIISFSASLPMRNFHSKSLDREFAVLYFVDQFSTGDRAANRLAPSAPTAQPQDLHPVVAPAIIKTPGEVVAGSLLRDASLDGLNTSTKSLSEYQGKPLIINVWASWCGPCRAEMGSLERLAKRYNGIMFNIIGISTDDYRDKAVAFIDQADLTFENYIDHQLFMENMLGAATIPLTVLVDADGRVLQKVRGSREWDSPEIIKAIGQVFGITLM